MQCSCSKNCWMSLKLFKAGLCPATPRGGHPLDPICLRRKKRETLFEPNHFVRTAQKKTFAELFNHLQTGIAIPSVSVLFLSGFFDNCKNVCIHQLRHELPRNYSAFLIYNCNNSAHIDNSFPSCFIIRNCLSIARLWPSFFLDFTML